MTGAAVLALSPAARANNVTLNFESCTLGCTTAPFATVSFVQDLDGKSIDLSVTLGSDINGPYHFHRATDTNHWALAFDLIGTPDITINDPSGNFTAGGAFPGTFKAPNFGNFEYGLRCSGCASGYASGVTSMNIVITPTTGVLTPGSFVQNSGGSFFAVDIVDFLNNSGNTSDPNDSGPVPEPTTALLVGGALAAFALRFWLRRHARRPATAVR